MDKMTDETTTIAAVARIGAFRRRFTVCVLAVLVNYAVFFVGVYLDSYAGAIDQFGALLCRSTFAIGNFLIPLSVAYSFMRRFGSEARQWDLYGPGLAFILNLVMYGLFMHEQPWWLPPWS